MRGEMINVNLQSSLARGDYYMVTRPGIIIIIILIN